jgi:competence protein ComEA
MGPLHRALLMASAGALLVCAGARPAVRPGTTVGPEDPLEVEVVASGVPAGARSRRQARALLAARCPAAARSLPERGTDGVGERWQLLRAGAACRLERAPLPGRRLLALGLRVDVNRATAADLEAVPGLGRVTARRVLAERQRLGGFSGLDQLGAAGIGRRRLDRLEAWLEVGPPPSAPSAAGGR